jgi:nickel-dependent lactate racemase
VTLPDANVAAVLRMNRVPVVADVGGAVREGLAQPLGAAPLQELARGRRRACIVVSDLTRPVPNALLLPPLLDALQAAGLGPERTFILVATGLHRGNTPAEWLEMGLGPALERGLAVHNHEARDGAFHSYLGNTSLGIPAWLDSRFVAADLRLVTGLVEPHLMAGFSGGRKAICPGLCGAETIMRWHSPAMLEPAEARAGNLAGNQVHLQALEVARLAGGTDLAVNVTLNEERQVTGLFVGDLEEAHQAAVEQVLRQCRVTLPEPVDIVVTSAAGHPLDLTFYQGIKGMIGALPILKPGGTLIIAQENSEGIGGPEFTRLVLETEDPHDLIRRALAEGLRSIDLWQLHEQEKVLRKCEVVNVSSGIGLATQRCLFVTPASTVEEAVEAALRKHGREARIAVIPEGPYVLCEVG